MNKETEYNKIGSFLYIKYLLFIFMIGKNYYKLFKFITNYFKLLQIITKSI